MTAQLILCSQYDLYVWGQHGVLCEVNLILVNICRVNGIKLNQLVEKSVHIITISCGVSDVTITNIFQSLPHIMAGEKQLAYARYEELTSL